MMFGLGVISESAADPDLSLSEEKLSFLQATDKTNEKRITKKKQLASVAGAQACIGFFILKVLGVHLKMKENAYRVLQRAMAL